MSFSARTLRLAPRFAAVSRQSQGFRSFAASSIRPLKESDIDNPDDKERHKQDQLQKQKQGKNHWKPELASESEEAVAADKHEHSDHSEAGIKELQKKTEKHADEKHKSGTSQSSGLD